VKFSFEVGDSPKHKVEFAWNQFWGSLRIAVDGEVLFTRRIQLMSPIGEHPTDPVWRVAGMPIQLLEKWEFDVGTVQKHRVRIEKVRPKVLAGFRPHSYRALVDESVVFERTGF
jgi:hypothetical protein